MDQQNMKNYVKFNQKDNQAVRICKTKNIKAIQMINTNKKDKINNQNIYH